MLEDTGTASSESDPTSGGWGWGGDKRTAGTPPASPPELWFFVVGHVAPTVTRARQGVS